MKLGSLVVEIAADSAKFVAGVADSEVKLNNLDKRARAAVNSVGKYSAAATAAGIAVSSYLVTSSLSAAREINNLSRIADTMPAEFQKMAFGAQQFGIEQDKLSDILKDTKDRVGDFLSTGAGPMADFFENIAPKVGVTAEQFKNLSGRDALQLYVDSLQKANLSQAEMTFYMEAMASDSTALIPLLRDGGKALAEQADKAERLGIVLSDIDIEQMNKASVSIDNMGTGIDALVNQVGAEFAPVISAIGDEFLSAAEDAGGFGGIATDVFDGVVNAASFVVDAGDGIKRTFELAADGMVVAFTGASGFLAEIMADVYSWLDEVPGLNYGPLVESLKETAAESSGIIDEARANIDETLSRPFAGEALRQFVEDARVAGQAAAEAAVAGRTGIPQEGAAVETGGGSTKEQELLNAKIEAIRTANATEMELLLEKQMLELEAINAHEQLKLENRMEWDALIEETKARHENEMTKLEKRESDKRRRQAEQEAAAKKAIMSSAMGGLTTLMNSENKKMFEIGKKAAIANSLISTYQGMAKALELGFPVGMIAAAAIGVAGFAQVQSIRSQNFGGGGGAGSPSTGAVTGDINAQSEPVATQSKQPDQTMFVSGFNKDDMYGGELVEYLLDYQRNGGNIVLG